MYNAGFDYKDPLSFKLKKKKVCCHSALLEAALRSSQLAICQVAALLTPTESKFLKGLLPI